MRTNTVDAQPVFRSTIIPFSAPRIRRKGNTTLVVFFGAALVVGCGSDSKDHDTAANTAERKTPQSSFSLSLANSISVNGEAVYSAYEAVPSAQLTGAQQNGFSMTGQNGSDFITLNLEQSDPFPVQREIDLVNPAISREGSVLNAFFSQKEWASASGHVSISVFNQSQVSGTFQSTLFNIDDAQETIDVSGEFSGKWTLDCWSKVAEDAPVNDNIPPGGSTQVWEQDINKASAFCSTVAAQLY